MILTAAFDGGPRSAGHAVVLSKYYYSIASSSELIPMFSEGVSPGGGMRSADRRLTLRTCRYVNDRASPLEKFLADA
jgi:hypothetical protein